MCNKNMKQITRIYYKKLPKTFKLVTKDKYLGHFDIYIALIDLIDFSYEIKTLSGKIAIKGQGKTLHDAKIGVKKDMKSLGVSFYDEIRKDII